MVAHNGSHSDPFIMLIIDIHVLMRDEKEERSKQDQTNNKVKQHSTPKAVTFPKKNELPRVGLEPTTHYTERSTTELPCKAAQLAGPKSVQ